jgi:hypothetical protein
MSVVKVVTQNMAEDATYMIGYSYVNDLIRKKLQNWFPDELDEHGRPQANILVDVLSGGASFLFMSSMMQVIRHEEKIIDYLFAIGESVIAVLYARNKGFFDGMLNRVKSVKGVKARSRAKLLSSQNDPQNSFISQVTQHMDLILKGRNSSNDVSNTISSGTGVMDTAVNRERLNLDFAKTNKNSFHESILLKTMTGSFTEADKAILRKIIGREDFSNVPINIDEMNTVHEFMFLKDSSGKVIGLTKAFVSIFNAVSNLR